MNAQQIISNIAVFLVTGLIIVAALLSGVIPHAKAAYSATAKPMEFYLHNLSTPVNVAGLQTKYVMNTTRAFRFLTDQDAHANSFYKPVGLPKVAVDFYLYPNVAGPVTISGLWQVFLWINSSAYKPTTFSVGFQEVTVGGGVLWDSGMTNPTVTSSVGGYIDVPVYNYNLSVPLSHNFTAGTTLHVQAEVNAGASADTRIWFDSPFYPSKVILPAQDYARASSVQTYAYDGSETSLFHNDWPDNQRTVTVQANVTDPFGGYDIFQVNATIFDPLGTAVVNDTDMARISDGQWLVSYAHLYQLNWTYPTNATLGNYTVVVTVIDNNGYYQSVESGAYDPFIEESTHTFTIGIIVYYDPAFLITDDLNNPLPNAQVYITWPNKTIDTLPRYTSDRGFLNLTQIAATSHIGFTILWKDTVVQQTTVQVDSNGPYTIKTRVYQLTVHVTVNTGAAVDGAYVIVYTQAGVGYGLDTTGTDGQAVFRLPEGTYRVDAHYVSGYWLTVVKANASDTVQVTESMVKTIALADFPPAVWSTLGFLLLLTGMVLIVAVIAVTYLIFRRRKKAK